MSRLQAHFEQRTAQLMDCATLECEERGGAIFLRLRPSNDRAVGVTLYLTMAGLDHGTVTFDDQASVPAELGDDYALDIRAIDYFIEVAVEGRATGYHRGRTGGCIEELDIEGNTSRSWMMAVGLPGWRRRWKKIAYEPYR